MLEAALGLHTRAPAVMPDGFPGESGGGSVVPSRVAGGTQCPFAYLWQLMEYFTIIS